eukprot:2748215-Pyramimonas_sp.AAC.1
MGVPWGSCGGPRAPEKKRRSAGRNAGIRGRRGTGGRRMEVEEHQIDCGNLWGWDPGIPPPPHPPLAEAKAGVAGWGSRVQ